NSVTYNWRNLMLFETKCMLQNSEPSERTPPLARGSARSLARWASERANPLARSARDSEIFGSALVSSAGSLGSASRLGSMPTLYYILLPVTCIYFIIPGRNIGMYLVDSGLTVRNPANVGLSSIPCPLTRNPGRNRVKMIPGPQHPGLSLNLQYLGSSPV